MTKNKVNLVDKFLEIYSREYDYYLEAAKLCAQQCETGLEANGIRSIVTFRSKRPDRLKDKLEKRYIEKNYSDVEEIYDDIVDLSGVRIALYFPGDKDEVDKFIKANFNVVAIKEFPEKKETTYKKRFSGYWATHYRISLKSEVLSDNYKRYGQAKIEIQVASVLMHSWAEVEHDLVYKPSSGQLSEEEYRILDELNGLVLAGEIALERLQNAVKLRVAETGKSFNNHYELSSYLYDAVRRKMSDSKEEPVMGRADILYTFLKLADLDKPEHIEKFIDQLDSNTEKRPIVDQIIDFIIDGDESLYSKYDQARLKAGSRNPYSVKQDSLSFFRDETLLGYFINRWIIFEHMMREIFKKVDSKYNTNTIFNLKTLLEREVINKNRYFQIESIRRLRNNIIHGIELPDDEQLMRAVNALEEILSDISMNIGDDLRPIVDEAIDKLALSVSEKNNSNIIELNAKS